MKIQPEAAAEEPTAFEIAAEAPAESSPAAAEEGEKNSRKSRGVGTNRRV